MVGSPRPSIRRRLTATAAAAVLAGTLVPGTVSSAAPPPPPLTDIRGSDLTLVPGKLAEPSDDGPHPGSWTEWWYAHIIDPATHRTFIAMLFTAPVPTAIIFWYPEKGSKLVLPVPAFDVKATAGPVVTSSAGALVYDKGAGMYHLTWKGFAEADIWFTKAVPGVTGGPIPYEGGQDMYWSSPVATSKARGWLKPPGATKRIDVSGWRGYHDHNWGRFNVADQRYHGWEWGVSHEPDGSATLLGGVVRGDGMFQGVVGRATPKKTYGCMATLKLSDWRLNGLFTYPDTTNASCPSSLRATKKGLTGAEPGIDVDFHVVDPVILDVGLFALPESLGRTSPGSLGLIEHIRTLTGRVNP